jgi:hypothetical protein
VSISDSKTQLGKPAGTGGFTSQLTNLEAGTQYFIKAYITDGTKPVYGKEISFTTVSASVPTLTTTTITFVTTITAASGGEISSDGGAQVISRGVCWSTSTGPTTAESKTSDGSGTESFTSNLTGLTPNTTYYVRAYAVNIAGPGYGSELSFKTNAAIPPTLTTASIADITQTTATSGGNVTSDGGVSVTGKGVCWNTIGSPTTADSKTEDGTGTGSFASSLTGLTPGKAYYARAYATNSAGTAYGNELSFNTNTTTPTPPTAAVAAATSVTNISAILNGAVNANGSSTTVIFEYGLTNLYGSSTDATPSVVTGSSTTSVSAVMTGLTPGTLSHFRVKAVSSGGTAYSNDLTFTTLQMPDAITGSATSITNTTAILNGTVNANNLSTTVTFEYGTTIAYGNTANAVPNPINGGSPTSVNTGLTGLIPGTTYYFRVKAVSSGGTIYGDDQSFITLCIGSTATTGTATNIGNVTATLNGIINANSISTAVTFEYGPTESYGSTITGTPNPVSGNSNTAVSAALTGLTPGVLYHFRIKSVNCGGTTFGIDQTFITLSEAAINDTLLLCYSKLDEYIEFTYLFDAIYSNNIPAPNSSWTAIYGHTQSSNNEKIIMLWSKAYDIIYKTNFIIIKSEIVISNQSIRNSIIAQAKAIRAYLDYNLLIWFGGIPLEAGVSESMNPRNTIAEVLVQIKQDASEAAQYLPWSWSEPDKFRNTQSFAKGISVRASLYNNNYSEALTPNQDIINSSTYALSLDPSNFTSTNSEIFWGFAKSSNTEFSDFFTKGTYVPGIRFTESYLVAGEAYFNLGNASSAVNYINALIVRRGLTPLAAAQLTTDKIFQQWNTELEKEGSVFITLKRFNKAISVLSIATYKLLLPIPQPFLNMNPYLTQNPGY